MDTNNTNRGGIISIIVILLIIIIVGGAFLYYGRALAPDQIVVDETPIETLASGCGIIVSNPLIDQGVTMPVTVTGNINNTNANEDGCAWIMSEGQGGLATLHYQTKDGWSLPVDTKPIMVETWMSTTSTFSVTLSFDNSTLQLPAGYEFKIILTEENPSGEGTPDTVEIPVVLQ